MSDPTIIFWDCDESAEELLYTVQNDAIRDYLVDRWHDDVQSMIRANVELPVYGFVRGVIDQRTRDWIAEMALDYALEYLADSEFASNDAMTCRTATKLMKAAATLFADTVCAEYRVWHCEKAATVTVRVGDWVRENEPDWIEEDDHE